VFSVFAITNGVAAIVGSLLAGLPNRLQVWFSFEPVASYQAYFFLGAIFSFASMLLVIPLKEKKAVQKQVTGRSILPTKSWEIISQFSVVRAVGGFGFGITQTLIPLWFKITFGVGEEVLSIVYAISRTISLGSYFGILRFPTRMNEIKSIAVSRVASAVLMTAMTLSPSYVTASILLIVYRASLEFTMPFRQAFITSIVDPSERSSAIGISNLSRMSTRSFAPATGGYIMQNISMSLPFMIGSCVIALNGVLYYLFFHRVHSYSE
jgi:hypothetical protein